MSGIDASKLKVGVIGAGPSGTAMLRAFQSAASKGEKIPTIVCFEKQDSPGGLWNYSWRTGVDSNGEPIHNSMYRYLWSNGPKECLEFADYTFEEHFKKIIPSFPPREVLCDYIKGRLHKANVGHWIRTNTSVRDVSYNKQTKKFTIKARNLVEQTETVEDDFDYVVVATGHFSYPNVPYFEGFEKFEGRVLHAHDFRDACEFKDKTICVIGTSYSAEDIASQCIKYGCKSVVFSYRTAPMHFNWPANCKTVPLLTKVVGNTGHFRADPANGYPEPTTAELDVIILCTGYKHQYNFLPDELRLKSNNRLVIGPDDAKGGGDGTLHLGIVYDKNPQLMYLGMQDQWFTFNMFDAQAWWVRDCILGKIDPCAGGAAQMQKVFQKARADESKLATDEDNFRFQGNYVKHLMDLTDYPSFDMEGVFKAFNEWEHNKHEDIMSFRDKAHRSVMTGNMATIHHTPWMTAMDDSMRSYMADSKL